MTKNYILDKFSSVQLKKIYGSNGIVDYRGTGAAPIYEPHLAKMTITLPIRTVLCGVNLSRK